MHTVWKSNSTSYKPKVKQGHFCLCYLENSTQLQLKAKQFKDFNVPNVPWNVSILPWFRRQNLNSQHVSYKTWTSCWITFWCGSLSLLPRTVCFLASFNKDWSQTFVTICTICTQTKGFPQWAQWVGPSWATSSWDQSPPALQCRVCQLEVKCQGR